MRWKDHMAALLCCALSAVIVGGTVSWMEQNAPVLNAQDALLQAQQTVTHYCVGHKLAQDDLQLVNATAPASQTTAQKWQFEFYSLHAGKILVQVPEDGHPAQLSVLTKHS